MNEDTKKPVKRYVFDDISSEYYAEYEEPQVVHVEKDSPRQPQQTQSPEPPRTFVTRKEGPR